MPTMTRFCCILLMGLLAGCATTSSSQMKISTSEVASDAIMHHEQMLGKWYGNQPLEDGGKYEWLMTRGARGEYKVQFRITDTQGVVDDSEEFGLWGTSGDVYFSIFLGHLGEDGVHYADTSDPYNYDAYYILSLTDDIMKYRHARHGNVYMVKRVADDFSF